MGNYPRLTTLSPLQTDQGGDYAKRHIINSISNGKVILELEVLLKNFRNVGMSGQGRWIQELKKLIKFTHLLSALISDVVLIGLIFPSA